MEKIGCSESKSSVRNKKSKLMFPNLRSILIDVMSKAMRTHPNEFEESFKSFEGLFDKLDLVHKVIEEKDPVNLIAFLGDAEAKYEAHLGFEEVMQKFKSISVRPNEFYAIFNLYDFRHEEVDPAIRNLLGIEPEDFNLPAMAGWIKENPLFHHRDNNHVLRWASIAYFMFTLRMLKWTSMEDQYRVRFRVGTAKSCITDIRDQGYVALEKLCFLFYDETADGSTRPIYHFDKWLVYPEHEFEYVRPAWLSKNGRQAILNDLLYMINAYMIGIPSQYLVYLHEKSRNDRYKAVALNINARLRSDANVHFAVDEHQIADCFAKTIRNKVAQAMNKWDKRKSDDLISIQSDHEAIHYAKMLGLLPIPNNVLASIYRNVDVQ
jgi:hypothetical protein